MPKKKIITNGDGFEDLVEYLKKNKTATKDEATEAQKSEPIDGRTFRAACLRAEIAVSVRKTGGSKKKTDESAAEVIDLNNTIARLVLGQKATALSQVQTGKDKWGELVKALKEIAKDQLFTFATDCGSIEKAIEICEEEQKTIEDLAKKYKKAG